MIEALLAAALEAGVLAAPCPAGVLGSLLGPSADGQAVAAAVAELAALAHRQPQELTALGVSRRCGHRLERPAQAQEGLAPAHVRGPGAESGARAVSSAQS